MADKVPVKATYDSAGDADGLSEYVSGDTLGYAHGGTGLSSLGSAGQLLRTNSSANAIEWGAAEVLNIDGMTDGSSITIADGDKFGISDGGTEKYVLASQIKTYVGPLSLIDEDDMSSNSATRPPSQQSVKAYADGLTALTGGDLTIYEDANNADVSLKMGTSATEALSIEVLNGGSNKTAEEIKIKTSTASATGNHGKISIYIDDAEIMDIDDGGIDMASGKTVAIDGTDLPTTGGKVLQVVTSTSTDDNLIASTSFTDTGLAAAITPASSSNKVLVLVTQSLKVMRDSGNVEGNFSIERAVASGATAVAYECIFDTRNGVEGPNLKHSFVHLDSPSATTACTYTTQISVDTTSNNGKARADEQLGETNTSTITLIEIAG